MWRSILQFAAGLMTFIARRNADRNAPDVKEARKEQDQVDAEAQETRAVADRDAERIRRNLAE
jgi:hypothetical protein